MANINVSKFSIILLMIGLFFSSLNLHAAKAVSLNKLCSQNKRLESYPTLAAGRVRPLIVHAKETLSYLAPKFKSSLNSTQLYCHLSLEFLNLEKKIELTTPIEHPELRTYFKSSRIKLSSIAQHNVGLRQMYFSAPESGPLRKSIDKIFTKQKIYNGLVSGKDWTYPVEENGNMTWRPINQLKTASEQEFHQSLSSGMDSYKKLKGETFLLEVTYTKSHLTHWAMLSAFISFILLIVLKNQIWGIGGALVTLFIQVVIFTLRTIVSGRAPITNMYETVLFSGLGALFLAMIIGHFKKEKFFVLSGLGYNVATLMMINFSDKMLSSTIGPLVPVLRDNFWLSTHVTTIILSYGALALSWFLANFALITPIFSKDWSTKKQAHYADLIYNCLKWGTVLLAAGIILGGVWADYSWGRFWGWDPKETWSLIVLCIYMAIIHGKYTNWIPAKRFIPLSAVAFLSVMMAWFGVNYILASGLHSYGFSEGGAIFLASVFIAQFVILGFHYSVQWKSKRA